MIPKSPRAIFRLALWVFLLSLGGCAGSKPDPKAAAEAKAITDALCLAAEIPPPDSASADVKDANREVRALCAARKVLEKDGGG